MLSFFRSRVYPLCWLLSPSLFWSLSLHSPTLCVDALLLPAIERRLSPLLARLVRWGWITLYVIAILVAWNITPGTYSFYLHEALPFAPISVLIVIGIALLAATWVGLAANVTIRWEALRKPLIVIGSVLLLAKGLAAMEVVHVPALRQYLRSPTLANLRRYILTPSVNLAAIKETPDRTFYSRMLHASSIPPQVILMLVESWGEKPAALAAIGSDIEHLGFQQVQYGATAYRGSTLSGEFRELCSKYVLPSDSLIDEMKEMKCAPQFMQAKGYQVVGFHGFKKTFYARTAFWTRFGVQIQNFGDDMQNQPQCPGPFPGVCDEALIEDGIATLDAARKPTFLYMLTLSSHEPVAPAALQGHGVYFNEIPVVHPTQIITRRAISSLVVDLKNRRNHACTLVYVVGDHQPPSASARGGIFETGKVPYLMFSQDCPASPTN
jgi:hypothetical protein